MKVDDFTTFSRIIQTNKIFYAWHLHVCWNKFSILVRLDVIVLYSDGVQIFLAHGDLLLIWQSTAISNKQNEQIDQLS